VCSMIIEMAKSAFPPERTASGFCHEQSFSIFKVSAGRREY
jgi:hypothetical protein